MISSSGARDFSTANLYENESSTFGWHNINISIGWAQPGPEGHASSCTKAYHFTRQSHRQSCTSFEYCVRILHSGGSSSNFKKIVPKINVLYLGVVFKMILVEIHNNNIVIGFYLIIIIVELILCN